jgi:hypothetical protein
LSAGVGAQLCRCELRHRHGEARNAPTHNGRIGERARSLGGKAHEKFSRRYCPLKNVDAAELTGDGAPAAAESPEEGERAIGGFVVLNDIAGLNMGVLGIAQGAKSIIMNDCLYAGFVF